ncbi:odorant receptor 13a-like [Battus philenor]|uniref:odorant receptor 13a-like n=1 Tax=Battus philenor TaxID=42288 RepID=UPI0035D13888
MDETIQSFHRVLGLLGVSFFSKVDKPSKQWLFFQIFNFFIGFLAFLSTSAFVIVHSGNLLLFIQGGCIWTTGVIMFISLGLCLVFRNKFRMFLNEMIFKDGMVDMPFIKYVLENENSGALKELKVLVRNSQKNLLRFTRILIKTYVASVWLCATLYMCGPIYQMIMLNDSSLRLLAFDMWFPWSFDNFYVYVASFLFHFYCCFLCCISFPGLQCTIILLVSQPIRQLRIITFILQNLNEISKQLQGNNKENWQYCASQILSQCIEHYVKIKKFTNRLNVICQPFYLTLILDSIMLVCMCSVKIAVASKFSSDTMKYFIHGMVFTLVVLMFCLLGQQVENKCEKLEWAITEKWYLFDKNHKTNALIFSMAVGKGMPIYIFGSTALSLPTFTWFINTGMSFFTLVMSVLDG